MSINKKIIPTSMLGATLPGNSTVEMKEFEVPTPGFGQVLVQTKASTETGRMSRLKSGSLM